MAERLLSEIFMYFYSLAMVYILIFHMLVEVCLAKLQIKLSNCANTASNVQHLAQPSKTFLVIYYTF